MHSLEKTYITERARATIDAYLSLPFGARPSTPYFNNRRQKNKSALRVLKGKGTPEEIIEEAEIISIIKHENIKNLPRDLFKQFLVENDLGIDCSGFAYHVLNTLSHEKTGKPLTHFIQSIRSGFKGKILARIRKAENFGVSSFRADKNSYIIHAMDALPGDIITFIGTGKDKSYNHILVITGVEKNPENTKLHYAHSYAWPKDGLYNHGVREGEITITENNILAGVWQEQNTTGDENYTYTSARDAQETLVRRLRLPLY